MTGTHEHLQPRAAFYIVAAGVVIIGLVYGRPWLVPIVFALVISNIIEAMIERLERLRIPGPIALAISVAVVAGILVWIGSVVSNQIGAIVEAWPRYAARLETLTEAGLSWFGNDLRQRVSDAFNQMQFTRQLASLAGSFGNLVLSAALVTIYVVFLLASRGLIARKIAALSETSSESEEGARIVRAISSGVRQYLWIKTIVSVMTGGVSYAVLHTLGVDFAETWAIIIFLLNYIPSVGSVLGVLFPALLALVQFDSMFEFWVIAIFLSLAQIFIGNVVEPVIMGRFLNLSPLVVILSLTFWTMIWGIAGAFLSVPIMAAVLIVCSNVPAYRPLAVLLSDRNTQIEPPDLNVSRDNAT